MIDILLEFHYNKKDKNIEEESTVAGKL